MWAGGHQPLLEAMIVRQFIFLITSSLSMLWEI